MQSRDSGCFSSKTARTPVKGFGILSLTPDRRMRAVLEEKQPESALDWVGRHAPSCPHTLSLSRALEPPALGFPTEISIQYSVCGIQGRLFGNQYSVFRIQYSVY